MIGPNIYWCYQWWRFVITSSAIYQLKLVIVSLFSMSSCEKKHTTTTLQAISSITISKPRSYLLIKYILFPAWNIEICEDFHSDLLVMITHLSMRDGKRGGGTWMETLWTNLSLNILRPHRDSNAGSEKTRMSKGTCEINRYSYINCDVPSVRQIQFR